MFVRKAFHNTYVMSNAVIKLVNVIPNSVTDDYGM